MKKLILILSVALAGCAVPPVQTFHASKADGVAVVGYRHDMGQPEPTEQNLQDQANKICQRWEYKRAEAFDSAPIEEVIGYGTEYVKRTYQCIN